MTKIEALELELAARKMVEGTNLEWSWNPPKPQIPEGFTPWSGGECPVSPRTEVEVLVGGYGESILRDEAQNWRWSASCSGTDILAYRVVKPKTVMVELPVEHVEYWDSQGEFLRSALEPKPLDVKSMTFYAACRKALEGLK